MAVDPHVAPRLEDRPRATTPMPPAGRWAATRPGDLAAGQPAGHLLGSPGPDVGYALLLAERFRDRLELATHEHAEDAVAVGAEVAMRRAAGLGRAPVLADLEWAFTLLGYLGGAPADLLAWRRVAARGASHEYAERREIVDAVRPEALPLSPADVGERLRAWRDLLDVPVAAG